jgi:acyl-coenzyme A thioesterase PaaI-like protein
MTGGVGLELTSFTSERASFRFEATGWALRAGKSVAVTRSELRNDERRLIAVGTGTYTVTAPPA